MRSQREGGCLQTQRQATVGIKRREKRKGIVRENDQATVTHESRKTHLEWSSGLQSGRVEGLRCHEGKWKLGMKEEQGENTW